MHAAWDRSGVMLLPLLGRVGGLSAGEGEGGPVLPRPSRPLPSTPPHNLTITFTEIFWRGHYDSFPQNVGKDKMECRGWRGGKANCSLVFEFSFHQTAKHFRCGKQIIVLALIHINLSLIELKRNKWFPKNWKDLNVSGVFRKENPFGRSLPPPGFGRTRPPTDPAAHTNPA